MDNRNKGLQTWASLAALGLGNILPVRRGSDGETRRSPDVEPVVNVARAGVRPGFVESIFEESRGETFKALLAAELDDIRDKVRPAGLYSGHPIYIGGATRKAVRSLARRQARHTMKTFRDEQREKRGIPPVQIKLPTIPRQVTKGGYTFGVDLASGSDRTAVEVRRK